MLWPSQTVVRRRRIAEFDPRQARDAHGRWTRGAGGIAPAWASTTPEFDKIAPRLDQKALADAMDELDRMHAFFPGVPVRLDADNRGAVGAGHVARVNEQGDIVLVTGGKSPWRSGRFTGNAGGWTAVDTGAAAMIRHEYGHVITQRYAFGRRGRATPEQRARYQELKSFFDHPSKLSGYGMFGGLMERPAELFSLAYAPASVRAKYPADVRSRLSGVRRLMQEIVNGGAAEAIAEHLPGKHDQMRHGRKGGVGGWSDWTSSVSPEEGDAFGGYAALDYHQINDRSRTGAPLGEYADQVAHMDAAIGRARAPAGTVVYRGVSQRSLPGPAWSLVGAEMTDDGFMSTTLDRGVAARFAGYKREGGRPAAVVVVKVPKGYPAAPLDGASRDKKGGLMSMGEGEVLLQRGSTIKITGFAVEKYDLWGEEAEFATLFAEVVGS